MKRVESEILEFKKTTSELKEGIISIASMLNKHNKACVYFGIDNSGKVVGVEIGKTTLRNIAHIIRQSICPVIIPKIEVEKIGKKDVIKIEATGYDTPYAAYHKYYIRVNDSDTYMPNNVLEKYFRNKDFDYSKWGNANSQHTVDDVDENLLITFINEGNECGRISFLYKDAVSTLDKLHLLYSKDKNYLNNAGYYLFGNDGPLLLKLAMYPTDEKIKFSDIKQFRGNIFECINEGINYIVNNMKWSATIRGAKRTEVPEVPVEAIREVVVNSFAHLKVSEASANEIYLTPTRIHIYNPGTLIPGTDPKTFASHEQGSMIRNPKIAQVLYYNGTIDAFGTGFGRVFSLYNDIEYSDGPFGFSFDFIRNINENLSYHKKSPDNSTDRIKVKIDESMTLPSTVEDYLFTRSKAIKLYESTAEVYSIICSDYSINTTDIADRINMSTATVNRCIAQLKKLGLIKRVGSNKTGHWKVL